MFAFNLRLLQRPLQTFANRFLCKQKFFFGKYVGVGSLGPMVSVYSTL